MLITRPPQQDDTEQAGNDPWDRWYQENKTVRRNKTDRTDTKGILEAYRNAEIRPVPVKPLAQQSLTTLHRLRSGWMAERTARLNALRGLPS